MLRIQEIQQHNKMAATNTTPYTFTFNIILGFYTLTQATAQIISSVRIQ